MGIQRIEKRWSRRKFIQRTGAAGLASVGLVLGLTSCGGEDKSEPATRAQAAKTPAKTPASQSSSQSSSGSSNDPCNDLSGLTKDEIATRSTFKYVEVSDDPAKVCTNCNFWEAPEGGAKCGGCTLVKGPIHPDGGCMSWVAIQKT